MVFVEAATELHIIEALGRHDVITVLLVVGGVVWVCHDDDIVAHIVITHGVVAYDDTVMSAPVYVIDNDGDACLDIIDDKLGELPTTYLAIGN